MLNNKITVELPDKKNLKILKNGYVYYFTENVWDKAEKAPKDNRVAIGKLSEDKKSLIPNKKYYEIFKEVKLKELPKIDDTLSVGQYIALKKASEKFGVFGGLQKNFPKIYDKILAFVTYMIDQDNSIGQHYDKWSFRNYAGINYSLSSSQISDLYNDIDEESIKGFMKDYVKTYTERNKLDVGVAFDSTNQNTYAKEIAYAEFGHAKDDKKLPVINTAYLVDEKTGIPIFYETFYGSLLDKSETEYTIDKMKAIGFSKIVLVMDRGYFTRKNMKILEENKYVFLCPETIKITKELIKTYGNEIKDKSYAYIGEEQAYGKVIEIQEEGDYKGKFAYIFYDSKRADEERIGIQSKVEDLYNRAKAAKYFTKELEEKYAPYLKITKLEKDKTRSRALVEKDYTYIQELVDAAGYFVVISNENMRPKEMLSMVRKRDRVEKIFRVMKSSLKMDVPYAHNDITYRGKMFLCFVALTIRQTYRLLIEKYLKATSSNTTHTSFSTLSKILATRYGKKEFKRKYALTKNQKMILGSLDIKEKDLDAFIRNMPEIV